jgi:CHAD domain-containing protein
MRSDDRMAQAMPAELAPLAQKLTKNLRKARRGDPDSVHDSRTLIRRIRIGLAVMGRTSFDADAVDRLAGRLRDLERNLGPTRDDDVLLADLDQWLKGVDERSRMAAMPLRERVCSRRSKHARALASVLKRKRIRRTMRALRSLVKHPRRAERATKGNAAKTDRTLVRHFIHDETWRAYEEALAYEVRSHPDVGVIHKFRSSCRRLRYVLELFEETAGDADAVIEPLHSLQTRLGDLHDHAIAVARINKWMHAHRVPRASAIRDYVTTRSRARDRLVAEFEAERRAVTAPSFRPALFRALSDGSARMPHPRLQLVTHT